MIGQMVMHKNGGFVKGQKVEWIIGTVVKQGHTPNHWEVEWQMGSGYTTLDCLTTKQLQPKIRNWEKNKERFQKELC